MIRFGAQLLGQAAQFARTLHLEGMAIACAAGLAGYFLQYAFGQVCSHRDSTQVAIDFSRVIREIPRTV